MKFNNDINLNNLEHNQSLQELVEAPLVEALENYEVNSMMQFHIPGHTKGKGILPRFKQLIDNGVSKFDTTDEFDCLGTLHPSTGPINKAQKLAAQAFGAKRTFFLLNGSTVGNIAAALTLTKPNQKVLVARNSHRSVVAGLMMSGAEPIWIMPEKIDEYKLWGAITVESVKQQLELNEDIGAVWITNPTYEGVVSDVEGIAKLCKERNIPLLVDEAHGSLWNFHSSLPTSALHLGADVVVNSIHKTAGSFSQTSMMHISKTSSVDEELLESNLKLLHTTSPSILMLASLDAARAYISSDEGKNLISKALMHSNYIRKRLSKLNKVKFLNSSNNLDLTKIFIMIDGLSGHRLENILEVGYKIEIESGCDKGILILSNIGHEMKDIEYFCECIEDIVEKEYSDISYLEQNKFMPLIEPEITYSPRDTFYMKKEKVDVKDAVGRVCAELISICPPGLFVLVPGEIITVEHLAYLKDYTHLKVVSNAQTQ